MYFKVYNDSFLQGLQHVGAWAQDPIDGALDLLENGEGSRGGCLLTLKTSSDSISMMDYFRDHNLTQMKQWAYVSSKLHIMRQHLEPAEGYLAEDMLWPLISDNEEVIDWWRQNAAPFEQDPKVSGGDKNNPKSWMYYRYQIWLALNARWDELGERAEHVLFMQEEIKKDRSYLVDHHFYLALARGDQAQMEAVLLEKCTPKLRKQRYDHESALTNNFIVSYATVFAKLAWRSGYKLELDTPWIPHEWLPVQPLDNYKDPWTFMQCFDIWQPFAEPWVYYSPNKRNK